MTIAQTAATRRRSGRKQRRMLMIALGIIGQYLSKIYDEVKRRPRYLIRGSVPERPAPADEKGETVQSRRGGERVS